MRGCLLLLAGLAAVAAQNTLPSELKFEITRLLFENTAKPDGSWALVVSELDLFNAAGTELSISNLRNPGGDQAGNKQADKLADGVIENNNQWEDHNFPTNGKSDLLLEPQSGEQVATCTLATHNHTHGVATASHARRHPYGYTCTPPPRLTRWGCHSSPAWESPVSTLLH
jgi:hypothetical protein